MSRKEIHARSPLLEWRATFAGTRFAHPVGAKQRINGSRRNRFELVNVLYIRDEPSIGRPPARQPASDPQPRTVARAANSVSCQHTGMIARRTTSSIVGSERPARRRIVAPARSTRSSRARASRPTTHGRRRIVVPEHRRKGSEADRDPRCSGQQPASIDAEFPLGCCLRTASAARQIDARNEPAHSEPCALPFVRSAARLRSSRDRARDSWWCRSVAHRPLAAQQSANLFRPSHRHTQALREDARPQIRGTRRAFLVQRKGGRESAAVRVQTIEMNFLPGRLRHLRACGGHRTTARARVRYKGPQHRQVLNMTVNMALEFFENIPAIHQKLRAIQEVGLVPYAGAALHHAVGGESQRIKLASELSKRDTAARSTPRRADDGLHFEDIRPVCWRC